MLVNATLQMSNGLMRFGYQCIIQPNGSVWFLRARRETHVDHLRELDGYQLAALTAVALMTLPALAAALHQPLRSPTSDE